MPPHMGPVTHVPLHTQTGPHRSLAAHPQERAATRAGLGWPELAEHLSSLA